MSVKKKKSKEKKDQTKVTKKTTILKRKQLRKEKRQAKKVVRREYAQRNSSKIDSKENKDSKPKKPKKKKSSPSDHDKLKKDMKELKRQQTKQRKKQLLDANVAEERNIKSLEKNLGLKRRKSKNLPKCFLDDGLDYLLDACDSNKVSSLEENLEDFEDFENQGNHDSDNQSDSNSDKSSDHEDEHDIEEEFEDSNIHEDDDSEMSDEVSDNDDDNMLEEDLKDEDEAYENMREETEDDSNEWEDIYGRKRDAEGKIIAAEPSSGSKYVPPALRNKGDNSDEAEKKRLALEKLRKQLKGLLNRLAESNMYGISREIEKLYNSNSRNDVNNSLAQLLLDSLVHDTALIPAR